MPSRVSTKTPAPNTKAKGKEIQTLQEKRHADAAPETGGIILKKEVQPLRVAKHDLRYPGSGDSWSTAADVEIWHTDHTLLFRVPLAGVDKNDVNARIDGHTLTISARQKSPDGTESFLLCNLPLPATVDIESREGYYKDDTLKIRFWNTDADRGIRRHDVIVGQSMHSVYGEHPEGDPFPVDIASPDSPNIEAPETETYEPPMSPPPDDSVVIHNGTLFKGGVPYRPLSDAAPSAQTHRTTLLNWIKNKTLFAGRPLQSYYFAPANRYFVSEESIQRAANRFIKWPSEEPAGPVTIGETRDKTGYIGIPKAARILGVDHHTMWLWTAPRPSEHRPSAHATAPTDKPLDVIKDPASEQIYIREKDIARLKKLIPRSGLKRGRRPQVGTPQP